jgi:hypothetical protein
MFLYATLRPIPRQNFQVEIITKLLFAIINNEIGGYMADFFRKRSQPALLALGLFAMALIGLGDYFATTQLLEFSVFLLLPVAFFTWFISRRAGLFASLGLWRHHCRSECQFVHLPRMARSRTGMRWSGRCSLS